MLQLIAIGVGAGVATALLFASVASGALLSIFLFYLAPLPIMIAALGWGSLAGLIGAVTAAAGLAVTFGTFFFFSFLVIVGLPAWWLCRLALLARPADVPAVASGSAVGLGAGSAAGPAASGDLEWYPVGRLVLWAAILASAVVAAAILYAAASTDDFHNGLRSAFERVLRLQTGTPAGSPLVMRGVSNPDLLLDVMVTVVPLLAAVLTTVTQLFNLWLAGRVVAVSGRLRRPWPDLPMLTLPRQAPLLLAATIALTFLPGVLGTVSMVFAAALLMAFAILGLAVLHAITRGTDSRYFILAGVYGALFVFTWPVIPLALFGLAEAAFHIRQRFALSRRGPPATPV
jgi:hypothetical protein